MRNAAEREHGTDGAARGKLGPEVFVADLDFRGQRLVVRRQALDRIRDSRPLEFEAVVGCRGNGPGGKPELEQGCVQQYAGMVPGEWAAAAIRPVLAGRQAYDEQTCVRIAEGRHRFAVVVAGYGVHRVQESGEPRTTSAA